MGPGRGPAKLLVKASGETPRTARIELVVKATQTKHGHQSLGQSVRKRNFLVTGGKPRDAIMPPPTRPPDHGNAAIFSGAFSTCF